MRPLTAAQVVAAAVVVARLARGRRRLPPLRPRADAGVTISVVIPARDEAARIGPCLRAVLAAPAVTEVIVVDDGSRDGTAEVAASLGAKVVTAEPLPGGWVGKQWALRQGVAAAGGDIVVTLDADARPAPGLFGALAGALERYDLVSAGPRFACDGVLEQALHASMLATLVYRFGPVGPASPPPPHRVVANGQCLAFRRARMTGTDGFALVRDRMTDDVALARCLAGRGWAVGFLDAGGLLEVDMHDSVGELWREWGRSLPLRDVTGPGWQAADLAVIWLTGALPVLRLAAGRPTGLDAALLAVRLLLTGALRGSYRDPGAGLLLSPLLDPASAFRLTQATLRPVRTWRGRTYPDTSGGTYSETSGGASPEIGSGARSETGGGARSEVSGGGRRVRPGRSAGR
jgi:dolichol-phosphate mannosyltransferase